ncbi:hypothetical protein SCHPADRAFT_179765 [Schizopora paradoxa]|uniref:Uncharacterized protein n=1 Tax=Schizopora paradoxa TaxID=27342 RepID=A0A0H2S6E7_9AGAM|nr:hypothetical protein SCHPADRAFT_179765 [Schizopora paradoxa]
MHLANFELLVVYSCDADETDNLRLPYPPSPASSLPPATPTRCPSASTLMSSGFIGQHYPDSPSSRQGASGGGFSGFQTPLHDGQLFSPVDMSAQPFDSANGLRWLSPSSAISRMTNFSRSSSSSSLSSLGEGALNGLTPTAMMQMGCLDMFGEPPSTYDAGLSNFLPWHGEDSSLDAACGSLGPAFTLSNTSPVSDDYSPTSNVFTWPPLTGSASDVSPPPSSHSSLPSTPTHPRQTQQRFSSLPTTSVMDSLPPWM